MEQDKSKSQVRIEHAPPRGAMATNYTGQHEPRWKRLHIVDFASDLFADLDAANTAIKYLQTKKDVEHWKVELFRVIRVHDGLILRDDFHFAQK